MQKLIPTIYFYVLSAVGMVLFIIGLFNSIHYVVGITVYDKYPLGYGTDYRCDSMITMPAPIEDNKLKELDKDRAKEEREKCLKNIEKERQNKKVDDLEKSIAFTAIGLLVFAVHFYFARRRTG